MDDTERKDVVIAVRLSPEMRDRFKRVAVAEHRTVSAEMRRLIEQRVADVEAQEAA